MATKKSGGVKSTNKKPKSGKKSSVIASEGQTASPKQSSEDPIKDLREENDIDLASAALGSGSAKAGLSGSEDETPDSESENDTPEMKNEITGESSLQGADSASAESEGVLSADNQKSESGVCIVIPFRYEAAKADELRYAVRAWKKFIPECKIVIVGHMPPYLKEEEGLTHLLHQPTSRNPQTDVAHKLLEVCNSELVPDYFIISNDDIYPVAPVTITDLDLHTAMGKLGVRGSSGSVYRKNAANTLTALKKAGIKSPWDYATHTPVGVWKKELKEVINKFHADEVGHLVTTLYFNTVWPDHRPILVDNGANPGNPGTQSYVGSAFKKVPSAAMKKAFQERKFINNNDAGWTSVEPFLKMLFPDKSRFEK